MTGCEILKCPDFKDGKCTNESGYVSKIDGAPMCPRNDNAIPIKTQEQEENWREEYLQLPYYMRHPAPYGEEIYIQACRKRRKEIDRLTKEKN